MPYITKEARFNIEENQERPQTAGELNYVITKLCLAFLAKHKESYNTYNTLIGVLECAKMEIYRRKIAIYENEKCATNGDVY